MKQPDPAVAREEIFEQAVALHEQGKRDQAEQLYRAVLTGDRDHLGALHNLGILCFQRGDYDDAVAFTRQVVRQQPDLATAHNTLAIALKHLGRLTEAEMCGREALRLAPGYAEAHNTLGDTLTALGRFAEAEACCREALRLVPEYAEAHNNLSTVLLSLERQEEAEICCREVLRLKPGDAAAHSNLGTILLSRGRPEEAEICYREALRLAPGDAAAHSNLGTVLVSLGRLEEAESCYHEAVRLNPAGAAVYGNLGDALDLQGKLSEAVLAYERAADLKPDDARALEIWLTKKRLTYDWAHYSEDEARFRDGLRGEPFASAAFRLLGMSSTAAEQLAYAHQIAASLSVPQSTIFPTLTPRPRQKLRLGYFFLAHPTGHLIAGLMEHHDRRRFEIIGYCASPNDGTATRIRLAQAFDAFVDISEMKDLDAAQFIRNDQNDVLIDLIGFKPNGRAKIPAFRPAPIQVNYLGYPGTMGADYIDYIIVDRFVVPPDQQPFFSERLVHLPDCYQCNDDKREVAERTPSRAECGLPERGFVFCCFNDSYKLTPTFFDVWMRLLVAVPGSVLWLLEAVPGARNNLAREAAARGVAAERLVFAPRLPLSEHLARHRLADLFLDTLPYNAHTTASDALWAGLPVLTCAGSTFAGRVAGSLLRAIGLEELVTATPEEYEALALCLAKDAGLLMRLRSRLAQNRPSFPLFDTARSTRHLEAAYTRMCEIRQAGQPPTAFSVLPFG